MHLASVALAIVLALAATPAHAYTPPQLIPLGCNYDGGPTWLAVGRATIDPQGGQFRVEVRDVDLDRVEAQISPSSMHAFMPYAGPLVSPLSVAGTAIEPRHVDGTQSGAIITVRFTVVSPQLAAAELQHAGAISYVLVLNGKANGCTRGR
jgi:hypothetical protein